MARVTPWIGLLPSKAGKINEAAALVTVGPDVDDEKAKAALAKRFGGAVGSFSCHGAEPGDAGQVDKINQDCAAVVHPVCKGNGTDAVLFMVYDGHGHNGDKVSKEALSCVHFELSKSEKFATMLREKEDPRECIVNAFEHTQQHLALLAAQPMPLIDASHSGACAVVALLHDGKLYVAGAGDCRCVIGSISSDDADAVEAKALSVDHKCDLPEEQSRIEKAGGCVRPGVSDPGDFAPARFYKSLRTPWKGPGLCCSRGLGDLDGAAVGLISTPDTKTVEVNADKDKYLILASDGVWEFLSDGTAVDIVHEAASAGKPASQATMQLILRAGQEWRIAEGEYRDDITAIVVYLPDLLATLTEARKVREAKEKEEEENKGKVDAAPSA